MPRPSLAPTEPPAPTPRSPYVAVNGDAIRARRMELGHNLTEFAERAGITFQYLSMIERGQRGRVSPRHFRSLVETLDIDPDAIKAAA